MQVARTVNVCCTLLIKIRVESHQKRVETTKFLYIPLQHHFVHTCVLCHPAKILRQLYSWYHYLMKTVRPLPLDLWFGSQTP